MVSRRTWPSLAIAAALWTGGCVNDGDDEDATQPEDGERVGLSPVQLLTRASLDLRGFRPSLAEVREAEKNPDRVDATIATFVDDPAFGERIKDMFAGAWRTRVDNYPLPQEYYDEEGGDAAVLHAAIGEEPLNLIAYIALNDLPFTYLLEAQETFVDPALMELWPLEEVAGEGLLPAGVVRARYTDDRPLAGVLGYNAVFWRHASTVENANRGRANALSQALLCQSYLDRPIDFPTDLDLTDSESIRNAIANTAQCQGCHSTMDPLASYLWGFMYGESDIPRSTYSVAQERAWQVYTDAAPGFFGKSGDRLVDLAAHVADDERFVACAVRRTYEGMLGRPSVLADEGALAEHREAFLAGGLTLASLVRSIITDPSYRGERWQPRFGGSPEPVREKVAPVAVLAGSIAALSGYSLSYGGRPAARLDMAVRTLAGGSDRGDTTNVSTGAVLVQRRLAEAGAMHAVDAAVAGTPGGGALDAFLGGVNLSQPPEAADIVDLITLVRSQTIEADAPEIEALIGVWTDVFAISNPNEAWVAVLTAALADPDHLLY